MTTEETGLVVKFNREIKTQLGDAATTRALLATTFKGLAEPAMRQALLEGMIRGHSFEDFLKKHVYAVPFGGGYSLLTSIDFNRKVGMRSGVVGVSAPRYTFKQKDGVEVVDTCEVTVKRLVQGNIGEFTALVYFDEYYTGLKSGKTKATLWDTKPKTMIAKVAEMHALRKACPEELSQAYIEEEMAKEIEVYAEKPSRFRKVASLDTTGMTMGANKKTDEETTYEEDYSQAAEEEAADGQ